MKKIKFIIISFLVTITFILFNQTIIAQEIPADFVLVESGKFIMGSNADEKEQPLHEVYVDSFLIAKYEVTQLDYKSITGKNPSIFKGDNKPVNNVSWYEAVKFCNQKSKAEGLTPAYTGKGENIKCNFSANGYRLPTEAEWEFAAKGGNRSKNYKFAGSNNPKEVAIFNRTLKAGVAPVGSLKSNELGLYDMCGNVRELCWDWYGKYSAEAQNNPTGPNSGKFKIERGGSWKHGQFFCRITTRAFHEPIFNYGSVGLRLVRSISK